MKLVGTIDPKSVWKCSPELASATTSISNQYCITQTAPEIAKEINERVKKIEEGLRIHGISGTFKGDEKEREITTMGINFNDLEKDLKELGIELHTIRSSAGEVYCEIEGYFRPKVYKAHNARERLTPVHPVGPKPVPKKVIFSGLATTILWKDGTKTTVKCQSKDIYDEDTGVAMCYLKKMLGNEGNFNNIFREAAKVTEVR